MKKFLLPILIAAVALAAVLSILPAADTQAAVPAPQFEVRSAAITGTTIITANGTVQLVASGFNASDRIDFILNGARVQVVGTTNPTTTQTGSMTVTARVSTRLPYGTYTLRAENQSGTFGTYDALLRPALSTNVSGAGPGQPFIINGYGFAAGKAFTITWETTTTGTTGTVLGSGLTSRFGTLLVNATVPATATAGTYYVRGTSDDIGSLWVTAPQ